MSDNYEELERQYEDRIAGRYNNDYHGTPIAKWHDENFASFVAKYYTEGDRILDLGCGPASLWRALRLKLPSPGLLVGVDLSSRMIEEAKILFPHGDFRVGSMFEIPAESGSFDIVIVSSAFHHLPDERLHQALREIYRVLDEHGILIGREPLRSGRVGDRGGWISGALMALRHLSYRLTHTREYPRPSVMNFNKFR